MAVAVVFYSVLGFGGVLRFFSNDPAKRGQQAVGRWQLAVGVVTLARPGQTSVPDVQLVIP